MKVKLTEEQPTNETEQAAMALADEMISFMAEQFHEAGRSEKLELIQRYGPSLRKLHKIAGRSRRRVKYPGAFELKSE